MLWHALHALLLINSFALNLIHRSAVAVDVCGSGKSTDTRRRHRKATSSNISVPTVSSHLLSKCRRKFRLLYGPSWMQNMFLQVTCSVQPEECDPNRCFFISKDVNGIPYCKLWRMMRIVRNVSKGTTRQWRSLSQYEKKHTFRSHFIHHTLSR